MPTIHILSPEYFCSYSSTTLDARMDWFSGAVRTEMIPENQGATLGMKAREKGEGEEGRVESRKADSRSWMWSVSA